MNDIAIEAMLALVCNHEQVLGDYEGNECIYCPASTEDVCEHVVCGENCIASRVRKQLEVLFPGEDLQAKYDALKEEKNNA